MDSGLSIVAAYDDLIRNTKMLKDGCEAEFRSFVLNQEDCRHRWLAAEEQVREMSGNLKKMETEVQTLETRLKNARSQLQQELQRRKMVEQDRDLLERQISVVRELLQDKNSKSYIDERDRERLAVLNQRYNSTLNAYDSPQRMEGIAESSASLLSDISYDKTEEELEMSRLRSGRSWKRPTAPPMEEEAFSSQMPKRKKSGDKENIMTSTTTIVVDKHGQPVSTTTELTVPKLNKSFSESALDKCGKGRDGGEADSEAETEDSGWGTPPTVNRNANNIRGILKNTPSDTPTLRKASSAGNGLNRVHIFISKTVIKPETCIPCGKKIRFGKMAMRCKDCRATCHPDCRDRLPLPCIPTAPSTPGTGKLGGGVVADYTGLEPPMIPALVIHCANEVEARGMSEVGLYRVPGSDREVKELKEKFLKGKGAPNLSQVTDIHVVCGCLKDFLRNLKEPLVTFPLWNKFVQAAEDSNQQRKQEELLQAIEQLPQPNRDTLAFLVLHLQRISRCSTCKMPISNLAKMFGPSIVGYSTPDPEPMQMINETRRQNIAAEAVLEIPGDYWMQFINPEPVTELYPSSNPNTPGTLAPRSILGPVLTPNSYALEMDRGRSSSTATPLASHTPHTPKFATKSWQPKSFFSTPKLE